AFFDESTTTVEPDSAANASYRSRKILRYRPLALKPLGGRRRRRILRACHQSCPIGATRSWTRATSSGDGCRYGAPSVSSSDQISHSGSGLPHPHVPLPGWSAGPHSRLSSPPKVAPPSKPRNRPMMLVPPRDEPKT